MQAGTKDSISIYYKVKCLPFALIWIILFLISFSATSQTEATLAKDTLKHEIRKISENTLQKLKTDAQLIYERNAEAPQSLWDKIKSWLLQSFLKLWNKNGVGKFIEWGLIIFFLVFLILKILKTNLHSLVIVGSTNKRLKFSILEEDINKLNLDELIENAIENNDFRLATRFLFLKLLKQLSSNQWINWKINKTNREYFKELDGSIFSGEFRELASTYEFIWYGDFRVNQSSFEKIKTKFKNIFDSISINKPIKSN